MGKVLIVYPSPLGATGETAREVMEELTARGLQVDLRRTSEISELTDYDAVVLGSAVYMKRWRGDARHFLKKHRKALKQMPFWVFSSGPVGDPSSDPEWTEPPKIIEKVKELGGREHVLFGGCLPTEPMSFMEKAMVERTLKEYRDCRDWTAIREWACQIAAKLAAAHV